jgi:hypothetical protein
MLGKVNSGNFSHGTPIVVPHQFGTPVSNPEPQGNVIPQANATLDSNPVTWLPSPEHFGNTVEFSLQSVPPVVIVAPGSAGTVDINLTQLLDSPSAELSYSGAPAGVTISFAPNPDTETSVATVTVGSSVPAGKYTITVTGTGSQETNTTNIHLVVASGGSAPPPAGIALVAHAQAFGTGGSPAVTTGVNTTGATLLVATVSALYAEITISDSLNNDWQPLTQYGDGGESATIQMFYAYAPTVGTGHTFTGSGENNFGTSISVAAFSGTVATSSVYESGSDVGQQVSFAGTGNVASPGSATPANTGDLMISGLANYEAGLGGNPCSVDSGFTITDQSDDTALNSLAALAYLVTTTGAEVTPEWSQPTNPGFVFSTALNLAVFKAA